MTAPQTGPAHGRSPLGEVSALVDGGDMNCDSGLLLLITRAMRRLEAGQVLGVRSAQESVVTDLPVWADMVGHEVSSRIDETTNGPWWFAVRKTRPSSQASTVFSQGSRTPVGHRLWAYTNFDCNLACGYCCAESSPTATSRRLDPEVARLAFDEFAALGGREL